LFAFLTLWLTFHPVVYFPTLLEVLAQYIEHSQGDTLPFIDSSVDKVLLQTYQLLLDFTNIPKLHTVDTLLPDSQTFNRPAHRSWNLSTFFSFILTCIMLGLLSPGSAKADFG